MPDRNGVNSVLLAAVLAVSLACVAHAGAPGKPDGAKSKKEQTGAKDPPFKPQGPVLDLVLRHNLGGNGQGGGTDFVEAKGWKKSKFHGTGNVRVESGTVFLEEGNDMTGITWTGPLVRMNFEITLEAMRVAGHDFFCGLTFAYGKDPCSLIVGGWGGTCVGISSLDGEDAYNNETARFVTFEKNRWYEIRLRATGKRIQAWIDDNQIVDVSTAGRGIGIRFEVEPSVPLGISTWRTTGAIKNLQLRSLTSEEIAAVEVTKP